MINLSKERHLENPSFHQQENQEHLVTLVVTAINKSISHNCFAIVAIMNFTD